MTVKPLPKWAMHRYAILWDSYKSKEITYGEVVEVLNEKNQTLVSVLLSLIKKAGWMSIKLHPEDSRKRIYKLLSPDKAIKEMLNEN